MSFAMRASDVPSWRSTVSQAFGAYPMPKRPAVGPSMPRFFKYAIAVSLVRSAAR